MHYCRSPSANSVSSPDAGNNMDQGKDKNPTLQSMGEEGSEHRGVCLMGGEEWCPLVNDQLLTLRHTKVHCMNPQSGGCVRCSKKARKGISGAKGCGQASMPWDIHKHKWEIQAKLWKGYQGFSIADQISRLLNVRRVCVYAPLFQSSKK